MKNLTAEIIKALPPALKPPKGIKIPLYNQGVVAGHNSCRQKVVEIIKSFKKK